MAYYSKNVTIEEGAAGLGAVPKKFVAPPRPQTGGSGRGTAAPPWYMFYPEACAEAFGEGFMTAQGVRAMCPRCSTPKLCRDTPVPLASWPKLGQQLAALTRTVQSRSSSAKQKRDAFVALHYMARQHYLGLSAVAKFGAKNGVSGLGADPGAAVVAPPATPPLDLTDAATLTELKTAIGMTGIMGLVASDEGQKTWPSSFYVSPGWDERATKLWLAAIAAYPELAAQTTAGPNGAQFPTAAGVMTILAKGVGAPGGDPNAFKNMFPKLSTWYAAAAANPNGIVVPPEFTTAPPPAAEMNMTWVYGAGVAAALGLAYLVTRKPKRAQAAA